MRPRDYEDGIRRLNFPRRDQRAFWLLCDVKVGQVIVRYG
jgi:hypothetical protein